MGVGVRFGSAIASAMLLIIPGLAAAQTASNSDQLRMLGQCNGCIFEDLDLSGRKMTGVDLSDSTFRNVDFTGAGLGIAIFDNAVLENVSFEGADLGGASFTDATLKNVSFDRSDLTGAVFDDVILKDTDLQSGMQCNTQMQDGLMDNSDCD